jgi:hypothetical protein
MRKKLIIFIIVIILVLPISLSSLASNVTLKDYFDIRIKEHERRDDVRFQLMDKALQLQQTELERRLEGLNQLRLEVTKDREQFQNKLLSDTKWKDIDVWRQDMSNRVTIIETRSVVWTAALGIFFTLLQIGILLWRKGTVGDRVNEKKGN